MSIRLLPLVQLLAALIPSACLGQISPQQAQRGSSNLSAPTYTLDGVVVNSATGEPVRGALVQIYVRGQMSVLSGKDGKFHFEGVPQSQLTVSVRKPGFFSEQELSQGAIWNETVQVGLNTQPVVVKLIPESVIYGRVSDSEAEPVENLPVKLIYAPIVNGQKNWQERANTQTNEEGEFRFFELPPGAYYLKAGPSFSARIRAAWGTQAVQEGYPSTYYPGAKDLNSAAAIPIVPGKQVRADVNVKSEAFYQVSGTVAGYPLGAMINVELLSRDGEALPSGIRVDAQTRTFVAASVPAGSYVIKAYARGSDGQESVASLPVNVNSDVAGVNLVVGPSATIPVAVRLELARSSYPGPYPRDMPPVNVLLVPRVFGTQGRWASLEGPSESRSFAARNVEPSTYSAQITPNGPWYVESARCGNTNLFIEDLTVGPGGPGQTIEIVIRDDFARLNGALSTGNRPVQGIVLLIPELNPRAAMTVPVDPTGRFQTGELPPGEYRALAFDRIDGLEYTSPEAMRSYSSGAQFVRLPPNGQATVNLELQKRGD